MTTTYGNDATEEGVIKITTEDSAEGEQQESAEPVEPVSDSIELNGLKPGEWLKQLREQKNLSIDHVADRLYLDTGVVTALEAGDYGALPPPIFVRGYIRNYAKLLDVPSSDALVGAYNTIQPDESLPMITPQINYGGQVNSVNSKDWRVKTFTILFFLAVAALVVLGSIRSFSGKPMQGGIGMELPETIDNAGEHLLALPRLSAENGSDKESADNNETTATESSDDVDSVTISLTSTDAASEASAEEATPTFTAEQLHTAVVNYSLDSWTRIIDNTGEKVFEGVAKAGRSVTVTGEPPFKMRFGVVQGVTVEYKNEVITIENHPNRSGRSFTIGEPLPDTN
ncbi:RodZ domain-containing protein [Candidatus Albibeggiatoa sp. nov. BB20]|uniref:RodZ domain-containing protein n=1 Tax=Candidatus Albibeggiatoa sp. nov. BB20 TaxID=3162723 RepID=UPI0033657575